MDIKLIKIGGGGDFELKQQQTSNESKFLLQMNES